MDYYKNINKIPKIGETYLFLQSLIFVIFILAFENNTSMIFIVFYSLLNLICLNKIKYKAIFIFMLLLFPAILSLFVTGLFHFDSSSIDQTQVYSTIFGVNIYEDSIKEALFLAIRSSSISIISFAYVIAIDFEKMVNELMQNFRFPVIFGYALLSTVNAFVFMKKEFIKIKTAYEMRFLKSYYSPKILLPLLVSASRYAYQAGLSLESRGLNKNKTFYKDYHLSIVNYILLLFHSVVLYFLLSFL